MGTVVGDPAHVRRAAALGSSVDYALYAHPEYATNNGLTQYVSYFQPGTGYQRLEQVNFAPSA